MFLLYSRAFGSPARVRDIDILRIVVWLLGLEMEKGGYGLGPSAMIRFLRGFIEKVELSNLARYDASTVQAPARPRGHTARSTPFLVELKLQ